MNVNLNKILCKQCKRAIRAAKTAEKVKKKLLAGGGTYQQKQSWKYHIAKAMRLAPTPAEKKLRDELELLKDQYRWQLEFQKQIGAYIADCCIVNRHLVIEADGEIHETRKEYDAARDAMMRRAGWAILRFPNKRILNAWPEVVAEIVRIAAP